jgi:hypothetical protein
MLAGEAMASEEITRAFGKFLGDGDAEACLAALEAIPSRLWTEDGYQAWDKRLERNQEIHFSYAETKDVGRVVGKFTLIFKYAYKAVLFGKSRPDFPLKRCQGYLLSAFKEYHKNYRGINSAEVSKGRALSELDKIPRAWMTDEGSAPMMKLFSQLQCDLLWEQNKTMPYMTFYNLCVSEKTKPPPKQKVSPVLREEDDTPLTALETGRLKRIFDACLKRGVREQEHVYVFKKMRRIFLEFTDARRTQTENIAAAGDALRGMPEVCFSKEFGSNWLVVMRYMIEYFEDNSLGVMGGVFDEFRRFFTEAYFGKERIARPEPSVTFPASVSITDVELIDRELSKAFDKFYDKEPKLTWAYGCLQRIFQAVLVDEEVRQGLLQAIGSMYMRKNILREARLPNMRDTDFAEFFGWFCTQEGRAADAGSLSKLRVVVKELDRLVTSWGSG